MNKIRSANERRKTRAAMGAAAEIDNSCLRCCSKTTGRRKLNAFSGPHRVSRDVLEASRCPFKPVHRLLQRPFNYPGVVIAIAKDIVACRETVLGALDLHLIELFNVELMVFDRSPVMRRGIHWKARCKSSVSPDNQRILPGAAIP